MNLQKITGTGRFSFWLDIDSQGYLVSLYKKEPADDLPTRCTWNWNDDTTLSDALGFVDQIDRDLQDIGQKKLRARELRMILEQIDAAEEALDRRLLGYAQHFDVNAFG